MWAQTHSDSDGPGSTAVTVTVPVGYHGTVANQDIYGISYLLQPSEHRASLSVVTGQGGITTPSPFSHHSHSPLLGLRQLRCRLQKQCWMVCAEFLQRC